MASNRRGFSLVEMLIAVILIGIVVLMAMPRIERALVRRDLSSARSGVVSLIQRAKAAAVQRRQAVTVNVSSSMAWLTAATSGGSQIIASLNLSAQYNVSATSSAATLTFQPTGLVVSGTPFTVWLSRATRPDSIRVTGYGKIE